MKSLLSSEQTRINFEELEKKIFSQKGDSILIGGEEATPQIRERLKDEAEAFLKSSLYEVLEATIANEASNLLLQASNTDHLNYGKALHYWNKIIKKSLIGLSK